MGKLYLYLKISIFTLGIYILASIYQVGHVHAQESPLGDTWDKLHFTHQDHLGSTNLVTDEQGNIVSQQNYYPYGSTRAAQGGLPVNRQYTSQVSDQDQTGLYYYNARYYDPRIALFSQADMAEGLNRYVYVSNNPTNITDPSGNKDDPGEIDMIKTPQGYVPRLDPSQYDSYTGGMNLLGKLFPSINNTDLWNWFNKQADKTHAQEVEAYNKYFYPYYLEGGGEGYLFSWDHWVDMQTRIESGSSAVASVMSIRKIGNPRAIQNSVFARSNRLPKLELYAKEGRLKEGVEYMYKSLRKIGVKFEYDDSLRLRATRVTRGEEAIISGTDFWTRSLAEQIFWLQHKAKSIILQRGNARTERNLLQLFETDYAFIDALAEGGVSPDDLFMLISKTNRNFVVTLESLGN